MKLRPTWLAAAALAATSACSDPAPPPGGDDGGAGTADASPGAPDGGGPAGPAAQVAIKLGRAPNFLIGMGNDLAGADQGYNHNLDGAYVLGAPLDLHYAYLVGLPGAGGWPDWNTNGSFVNIMTDTAAAHGIVPMFTLYAMAAWGEANVAVLTDDAYMGPYWDGAKLLFERLALFDNPALVHFEPDWWGYAQQQSGGDPSALPARVGSLAPDCAGLPETVGGMGRCLTRLARTYSPKVVIGFHASRWAGSPEDTAAFLLAIGAGETDVVVVETLDRDAGCFEEQGPECTRDDGPWYWDETNQTSPNFHEHLAWAKAISDGTGKPLLWWQMPFGVPSDVPGGEPGRYRDNRVRYLFQHIDEFVAAGGVGAVFGTGAGGQTYITTDGDQFKDAVGIYFTEPFPL